jgi:hypothetical protein
MSGNLHWQGATTRLPRDDIQGGTPLKNSPSHSGSAFRIAIAVSLLAGTLLMFGSLRFAATHMQVTM